MKQALKIAGALGLGAAALATLPAWAQAPAAAPVPNKGDTAWMMVATVLVMTMIVPGLALFYGGLVRTKNMLSVLTQVIAVASFAMIIWVIYGYTMAFGDGGNAFIAGFNKLFLAGVTPDSTAATFTDGVVIPEYVFIAFQMTFAAITVSLVIGGLVERMKFSGLMVFALVWLTIVYFPIAHMVWAGNGLLFNWQPAALDFAGGTVVHINAGISALVGAIIIGPRLGYKKDIMAPHSLVMTLIGTGLLWVGWFGFNAGSALEANGSAALAMINTFVATAAGVLFWMLTERMLGHKASLLGAIAAIICAYFVVAVKPKLNLDDSLDAFGIHGIGGIVGSIGTAFTMLPGLGGPGAADYALGPQLVTQVVAVAISVAWAGVGSGIAFTVAKAVTGLRVSEEVEREGLDLGEHGERAYNY